MDNIRSPDNVQRMRLDGYESEPEPSNQEAEENKILENMELEEIEKILLKQIISESKRSELNDLFDKLNYMKNYIDNNKKETFNELINLLENYIEDISEIKIHVTNEMYNFVDWLCTKTVFSRYPVKEKLKNIIILNK
jgi:predicted RNA binding protein with dsRBD fold (UPF0201 family)